MRIPILSDWLDERRFDRDHRPFLTTRYFDPDPVTGFQSGLMGFWCTKHNCWFGKCPK